MKKKYMLLLSCWMLAILSCKQNEAGKKEGLMEIGVARVDITPQTPIRISGFAARVKTETGKVLQPLSAKALAFGSDAQGPTILITVDLLGIQWRVTKTLVKMLAEKMNMNPAQIAIFASHTHGGPEIGNLINHLQCRGNYPVKFNFSDSLLELDQLLHIAGYNEMLIEKLQEVALAALKDRKPAKVAWAQGQALFSENRRPQGGPVDQALPVLRITNPDGSLRAVLTNYACHGISLGADVNEVHGDWMGEAQRVIEERHPGVIALVSIGCSGDAHPKKRDSIGFMRAYGKEIADNVDQLLQSEMQPLTSPPVGTMKWIQLPFAGVPTVKELMAFTRDTTIKGYYARLALDRIQRGDSLPAVLNYPLQTWNFGNQLLMINMGGEVVADYAVRLKKDLGGNRVWINAYSNDIGCYIGSRRVINEGGYEADASMYWYDKPSPLSDTVEDLIVNTVHEMTPAAFKKK